MHIQGKMMVHVGELQPILRYVGLIFPAILHSLRLPKEVEVFTVSLW